VKVRAAGLAAIQPAGQKVPADRGSRLTPRCRCRRVKLTDRSLGGALKPVGDEDQLVGYVPAADSANPRRQGHQLDWRRMSQQAPGSPEILSSRPARARCHVVEAARVRSATGFGAGRRLNPTTAVDRVVRKNIAVTYGPIRSYSA